MGDRANVVVKCGEEKVCLYTHWSGTDLPTVLQGALAFAKEEGRLDDFSYLNRIIFERMIDGSISKSRGFGISVEPPDGHDRILTVNLDKGTVGNGTDSVLIGAYIYQPLEWE